MINGVNQYSGGMNGIDFSAMRPRREDMFTKMDTNGDGSIDKAELTSLMQQLFGTGQAPPDAEEMFLRMDTDSDGKISKAEFEKDRRDEMFAKTDSNGDGSIDKAELESFRPQGPGMGQAPPPPDAEEMLSRMDTDGDGNISKAEFDSFNPETERPARLMTLEQSGLGNETTATTLSMLLNTLESDSKDNNSLLSSILQQYSMSVPSGTQSIINLLG